MVMIFSFVFLFFLFYVYICVYIYMYLCVCIYNNHTSRLDQNRYPHRGVLLLLLFPFSPGQSRNGRLAFLLLICFFFSRDGNKINRCWRAENVHGDFRRNSRRRSIFLMQLIDQQFHICKTDFILILKHSS